MLRATNHILQWDIIDASMRHGINGLFALEDIDMRQFRSILFAGLTSIGFGGHAYGAAILIDFRLGTAYSGTDSPGHEDGLATGGVWNAFAADKASRFVDEKGNPIAGLSVDLGTRSVSSVNYTATTGAADYANGGTCPLWDMNLDNDHVVRDIGGFTGVGIAVSSLAAGEYDSYLTGFQGDNSISAARDYRVAWDVANVALTDFSAANQSVVTNSSPTTATHWIAGDCYITGKFVVAAGDVISFQVHSPDIPTGTSTTAFIGVVNSLEIVPIAEPATITLVMADDALVLRRRVRL